MIRHTGAGDEQAVYRLICELENDTVNAEAFAVIYRELIKAGGHILLLYGEGYAVLGMIHLRIEY